VSNRVGYGVKRESPVGGHALAQQVSRALPLE